MFDVSLQQIYKSKCGNYYIGIISVSYRGQVGVISRLLRDDL